MNEIELKTNIFDLVTELHNSIYYLNKNQYKLCLYCIEELNRHHFELTKEYYIDNTKLLDYHRKMWEIEWKKC